MVYILHIDTSAATGLVLLAADGVIVSSQLNETERDHAGSINRMIASCLQDGGISMDALTAVAVCSGPGSYTGLRIGMATAKGLCYALNLPLIVHSKLELLFDSSSDNSGMFVAVLPARPGEYFMAAYEQDQELSAPAHMTVTDLNLTLEKYERYTVTGNPGEDVVLPGENVCIFNDQVISEKWAAKAFSDWLTMKFADLAVVEPLYLKQVFIQAKDK